VQRSLGGEESTGSWTLLLSTIGRATGALGLLDVLFSVGGQSFVAPFSTAPSRTMLCFLLGCCQLGRVGGHKLRYAAMLQSSSRAGVKVSMLSLCARQSTPGSWFLFGLRVFGFRFEVVGFTLWILEFCRGPLRVNTLLGALCPSKSGLLNEHIVNISWTIA